MAIAASFAALFLLAYTAVKIIAPDKSSSGLTENEIYAALESDIHYIDEVLLFNMAYEEEKTISSDDYEFSDEEIIEYLTEEGVDLDNLFTGF